jgi:hypothetical protein
MANNRIALSDIEESTDAIEISGAATARRLDVTTVTMRCRLLTTDDAALEALRYARRAMLREEWTLGVGEGEPSLEDAVFSAFEIAWSVPAVQREWSRAKLQELVDRANRVLRERSVSVRS